MDAPHARPHVVLAEETRAAPRVDRGLLRPVLTGLALRLLLLVLFPIEPAWDGTIYAHAADRMAEGEGFTRHALDPREPSEPTAFYPVGWPAMLVPLRWLGGGRALDPLVAIVLSTLTVLVAGVIGRRAGGARAGRIAAWAIALWPGEVLWSLSWMSESAFSFLVALALLSISLSRRRSGLRAVVVASLVLGLAAHLRPVALPIGVMLAGGAGLRAGRGRALGLAALALAVMLAVLAPWSVRSSLALGGPVLVSTNGGANLLIGTVGQGAYAPIPEAIDCEASTELEADRCRTRVALGRIAARPVDALSRAVLKLAHTFGHESAPAQAWASALRTEHRALRESAELAALAACRASWLMLVPLALLGAALVARRRGSVMGAVLLAPIAGTALTHAVFLGGDRYHAPAVVPMIVLAALAWTSWRDATRTGWRALHAT